MEKTLYKVSENSFTAREVIFAGTPGYMVCQYNRGRKAAEQFVDADGYKAFCDIIGVVPTIIDERDTPHPELKEALLQTEGRALSSEEIADSLEEAAELEMGME